MRRILDFFDKKSHSFLVRHKFNITVGVTYLDSSYFLDYLSDNHTERTSAEKLKPRLQSFKIVVPQVVLGEILTVLIRDVGYDLSKFKKKLDTLAKELTALIDPSECLPVLESTHINHAKYFMEKCGIDANDASILSFVVDDPESDYLVTGDQNLIESKCVYEYEGKLRDNGKRKRELKITDDP
jgi:predicted nucleic acid-binding protein